MKTIKLVLLLAIISLFGCDDKLEIRPKGQIILSTAEEYAALMDDSYLLRYTEETCWYSSFDAGIIESLVKGEGYIFIKTNYLGLEDVDRTISFTSSAIYSTCYERISRYNMIITNIMKSVGTEEEKVTTLAEAKVLRAYNYFTLANIFCKPYIKETAEKEGGLLIREKFSLEETVPQSSLAEVYQFIEKEVNEAIPNLKPLGINANHPGAAFAYALLAKVHLFKHEFTEAEAAAKKSLELHSYLFDWVAWDTGAKPAPEIGYNNEENLLFTYGLNEMGPSGSGISPQLAAKYTPGDLRKERFFWMSVVYLVPGAYAFAPYSEVVNGNRYTRSIKYNVGGMKVSEVVLMLAECYARDGKVAEALKLVNDLRKKRILPSDYSDLTASTKEEAFQIVLDERSRELPITNNNFYDIRRLEAEGFHQSVERVLSTGAKYTVKSSSTIFTMPFPRDAIERSGTLKQNVDR